MTTMLNVLLEITVYSAILYGAILLVKKIFHKYISAAMNYAVWTLLIIRLLMPITIDSGFSLFVIPEPQAPVVQSVDRTNTPSMAQTINAPGIPQTASQDNASYKVENTNTDGTIQASLKPSVNMKIDWKTALVLLWAAGILGSMACIAALGRRLNRKIRLSSREVPSYVLELVEECRQALSLRSPCTTG